MMPRQVNLNLKFSNNTLSWRADWRRQLPSRLSLREQLFYGRRRP